MFTLAMGFGNPTEIAIIAGVIVLLFGGAKVASFGKSIGQGIRGFKEAVDEDPPTKPTTPHETIVKSEV